jgi:hypothetical protein
MGTTAICDAAADQRGEDGRGEPNTDELIALRSIEKYGAVLFAAPLPGADLWSMGAKGWVRSHERGPQLLSLLGAGREILRRYATSATLPARGDPA